jgi:hypothetical protein
MFASRLVSPIRMVTGGQMTSFRSSVRRAAPFLVAIITLLVVGVPVNAQAQLRFDAALGLVDPTAANSQAAPLASRGQEWEARSWRERHPLGFPTLIGTAAGAAIGCWLGAATQTYEEVSCAYLAPPFGLLGAAIGVVPGMVMEKQHENHSLSFNEVRRQVKPGTPVVAFVQGRRETLGRVVAVAGNGLTVRAMDGSTSNMSGREGTWHFRTDSLKNGILIGTAIGAVATVVNYREAGSGAISGVPIWALIGALADRAISHRRLVLNEPSDTSAASFRFEPRLGVHSAGLALHASF